MNARRRRYTPELKRDAISRVLIGNAQAEIARELGVDRSLVSRWVRAHRAASRAQHPDPARMDPEALRRALRAMVEKCAWDTLH